MFKDLSLKSRNIQTQNCAPIQCTVWPRDVLRGVINGYKRNTAFKIIRQNDPAISLKLQKNILRSTVV